ncbi:leucine-rich repeat-containing protein kinase family protein [Rufibacter ruber]|uniref:leucine-rich repeat-containing protein kinase family protein n=1 Tax=Rufibacter ruber TaxID=1783499 RepID=UPI00082BA54A|nr:leucine-rich repeat-containing protein kinase family protein [Rufibacter ruber]
MHTLHQLESGQLKGTKTLKLSCGLTHLPQETRTLAQTLEVLDLSGNQLTALPDWMAELTNLRILFCSNNPFTTFPAVLGQCPKLEMIGFKACRLTTVPEGALPPSLRWLTLTDNQITQLPASIGQCTRLQKCLLAGNRLTRLPAEMAQCQHLELLRISANHLTALPDWLFSLPRLSWLAFAGNPCQNAQPLQEHLLEISWENLTLEEQVGEGASGIITKALWHRQAEDQQPQQVAVKVFKGEVTSDGFPQDERQACMAAGDHPNLVQVLGKITQHPAQKQGLVFRLIPQGYRNLGGSPSFETCTRDVFAAGTAFSLQEVLKITSGIAAAAAHLHARHLLHGDLYAHNTLVDDTGHALFGDFGAATLYKNLSTEQAAHLERIEVRAFGYLLEDLLTHLAPAEVSQAQALFQLQQACLQPEPLARPGFATISAVLGALAG